MDEKRSSGERIRRKDVAILWKLLGSEGFTNTLITRQEGKAPLPNIAQDTVMDSIYSRAQGSQVRRSAEAYINA
jgi:hypothetical protein